MLKIPVRSFLKFLIIYSFSFLCAGLRCCTRACSSCGERGYSSLWCVAFSLQRLLLLQSAGSRARGFRSLQSSGSAVVAQGHSRSTACGIFLDQGLNLCSLHSQVDSYPLSHQGSPCKLLCLLFYTQKVTLEKEMATHSSTLAWKIPWMEKPSRL